MTVDVWPDLPPAGPATLPAARLELRLTDSADDDYLTELVAAVNDLVRRWPVAEYANRPDVAAPARIWPASVTVGATRLVARLYSRRNSPTGVESFGLDGPVYVQRNDPDIAQLLELGGYARPIIG